MLDGLIRVLLNHCVFIGLEMIKVVRAMCTGSSRRVRYGA